MYLSEPTKNKILEFVNKFPIPKTNDDEASAWTHMLCEQLKHSFPTDGWGHKFAGPGRPHSADVICLLSPFIGWDIVSSAGSPDAKLNLSGESIDLTGQIYEPVAGANHLGSVVEPPVPNPEPPDNLEIELLMKILSELMVHTTYLKAIAVGMTTIPEQLKAEIAKGIKIRF
jgi:hypothetical protein